MRILRTHKILRTFDSPGKRLCAGETHARNLMFLLTTTILQNFDISVSDESKIPRDSDFITGIASFVPEFFVKFEAR